MLGPNNGVKNPPCLRSSSHTMNQNILSCLSRQCGRCQACISSQSQFSNPYPFHYPMNAGAAFTSEPYAANHILPGPTPHDYFGLPGDASPTSRNPDRRQAQRENEMKSQQKKADALSEMKTLMEMIKQRDRDLLNIEIAHMETRGGADAVIMAAQLIRHWRLIPISSLVLACNNPVRQR
ncbi:hypothetical protein SISNIDRAFT_351882 [Sistotremastrum niveocremeum HHB9708]|uniref:Uncharacterized protein n=1 Tax=Sistotremastrum niveocremeum HHB9708 TaxID=1314777 RepID=A0A164X2B4_9AGAM|nr:hypothetical protein SISNIDRAFT_351882 [Sistotremastrum niveocremeum HHB9708]